PSLAEAWLLIGDLQRAGRESVKALQAYEGAIRAAPANLKARNAHAEVLAEIGRTADSRQEYRVIASLFPENVRAAHGSHLVLPQAYESKAHVEKTRAEYIEGLERLHDIAPRLRFSSKQNSLAEASWTNFFLAYQGHEDREPQRRFGELQKRLLE